MSAPATAANPEHPRRRIREKVVALLRGATDAGDRVWPSRTRHLEARRLPACGVYTLAETSEREDVAVDTYDRSVTVVVEFVAAADERLDDELDALAAQAEAVLLADPTWGGVCGDPQMPMRQQRPTELVETTIGFAPDEKGAEPFACLALEFRADYVERPLLADAAALAAFKTAHFDWRSSADAEDTAALPQEEITA